MAARVSFPLADILWKMRTPIEGNDAGVMNHFDENRHVAGTLHDSNIVVVGSGKHGRSSGCPDDAALRQRPVFRTVEFMSAIRRLSFGLPLAACRCQRRNLSIRRIDDQRSSPGLDDARSAIPPEVIVGAADVGFRRSVAAIHVVPLSYFVVVFSRFLFGKEFFPSKLSGSFQRRDGGETPCSLQIRLTGRRRLRAGRRGLSSGETCCQTNERQATHCNKKSTCHRESPFQDPVRR